jgi:vacuolar protein sorting-associated protein 53
MLKMFRPSLEEEVEFMSPVDTFLDLCNKALAILIAGAMNRIEKGSFRLFRGTDWGIVAERDLHVGTESKYIGQLNQDLSSLIPDHRKILSATYYRNFCTKLSVGILDKFRAYLLRQKKISPFGARQLLIDCDAMLSIVSSLSNIGFRPGDEETPILPASLKVISDRMTYIQILLKLMQLDEAVLDSSFRVMLPDGKAEDLKLIKEIRHGRDLSVSDHARQAVETLKPSKILPAFNFDFGFGGTAMSKSTPQKIGTGTASTTPQGKSGAGTKPSGGR